MVFEFGAVYSPALAVLQWEECRELGENKNMVCLGVAKNRVTLRLFLIFLIFNLYYTCMLHYFRRLC